MHCRIPRKIKRYMTDPDEIETQLKCKYNNLTLQEIKLQLNPFEALNQINVPSVPNNRLNNLKTPTQFAPLQQKYHLHANPLKKSTNVHLPPYSINNGYEMPKTNKLPLTFKRSNPLFVVNSLIDILKDDNRQATSASLPNKIKYTKKELQNNEFNEFQGKSMKIQRPPRLIENQLNLLTQQSKCERRKIYSEQKSRKPKKLEQVQLLTFYKPKKSQTLNNNQQSA